jgi:hypothetical protein
MNQSKNLTSPIQEIYVKLRYLLKQKQWQLADLETRKLMLVIAEADQREDILLTEADLKIFPCIHLRTIDQLWVNSSQEKFGFSLIYKIYQEENKDYFRLAKRVGWYDENQWIQYETINFSENAPSGHLPLTWLVPTTFGIYWSARFASAGWRRLLDRFEQCHL